MPLLVQKRMFGILQVVRLLLVVLHRPMNRSSPQAELGSAEMRRGFRGFRGRTVSRSKSSCKQTGGEKKGDRDSLGGPLPKPEPRPKTVPSPFSQRDEAPAPPIFLQRGGTYPPEVIRSSPGNRGTSASVAGKPFRVCAGGWGVG